MIKKDMKPKDAFNAMHFVSYRLRVLEETAFSILEEHDEEKAGDLTAGLMSYLEDLRVDVDAIADILERADFVEVSV